MKTEVFLFEKKKGGNELQHDFGAGTGDAFKVINGGNNNRRKRSTLNENMVLKSIFRAKRQAESNSELETVEQREQSMLERIKRQFNHIVDVAQEMLKKIQQIGQGDIDAE